MGPVLHRNNEEFISSPSSPASASSSFAFASCPWMASVSPRVRAAYRVCMCRLV